MLSEKEIESLFCLRYNIDRVPDLPLKRIEDFIPNSEPRGGWAKATQDLLELAIYSKLHSYDTIGISLSGGIDSSLLLALIRKIFPSKKIIAVHDEGSNETEMAKDFADRYSAGFVSVFHNTIIDEIPEYVAIAEEPRWNMYHHVMPLVAKNLKCDVLVTGDAADELFGGYVHRYKAFMGGSGYLDCHRNDWVEDYNLLFKNGSGWFNTLQMAWDRYGIETLEEVFMRDYNGKFLRDILPMTRQISKWHDIPIVSPFLELDTFATHIPTPEKYSNEVGKKVLRNIAKNINLPVMPKKIGFSLDIVSDFQKHSQLYYKMLENVNPKTWDIINQEWMAKHITDKEPRVVYKFLQILALGYYL